MQKFIDFIVTENLALKKRAYMSSVRVHGLGPDKAVNGHYTMHYAFIATSAYTYFPWFAVDLGAVTLVDAVVIQNRDTFKGELQHVISFKAKGCIYQSFVYIVTPFCLEADYVFLCC